MHREIREWDAKVSYKLIAQQMVNQQEQKPVRKWTKDMNMEFSLKRKFEDLLDALPPVMQT